MFLVIKILESHGQNDPLPPKLLGLTLSPNKISAHWQDYYVGPDFPLSVVYQQYRAYCLHQQQYAK